MFIFIHFFFILLLAYFSNQDFTPLMHIIVVGLTITEKPVQNIILMTLCCKSLHSILPDQKKKISSFGEGWNGSLKTICWETLQKHSLSL